MMRRDERGVIVPAPLQFNNPASASMPRYGDKHRGPAVLDAYDLSDCRIALAEQSRSWPKPESYPPLMVETFQRIYPDDQLADALRHQANREEADRLISYAVRTGELPIWTRPIGEQEQLVATSALATIDNRSIITGVFCPMCEEHKPEDRRPWLWERTLFVKRDDWVEFAHRIECIKAPPSEALKAGCTGKVPLDSSQPKLPPDDPFVTLCEALSWIAFKVSMPHAYLQLVLNMSSFGGLVPQEAIRDALAGLVRLADGGKIAMRGKFRPTGVTDHTKLLTELIAPIKFADYRQFNHHNDELRHGTGLTFWRLANGALDRRNHAGTGSFVEVGVNRGDLLRLFPPQTAILAETSLPPERTEFSRSDEASIDPWWTVNQALAWVASGIPSYVKHVADLEGTEPRDVRRYLVHATCEADLVASDEGKAFMQSRRQSWPEGTILAHAGRALLDKILAADVRAIVRERGGARYMNSEDFVGIGLKPTGSDWLDLEPPPLFNSAEVMKAFPVLETDTANEREAQTSVVSTAAGESACKDWLLKAFAADPDKKRAKGSFRAEALAHFGDRLSLRGFLRAWDAVALTNGRTVPGRKS